MAGLFMLVRKRNPDGDRPGLIDSAILTVGIALLSWVFLIEQYADEYPQADPPSPLSCADGSPPHRFATERMLSRMPRLATPADKGASMTKQELVERMRENKVWVPGKERVKIDFGGEQGTIMLDGAGEQVSEDDGAADTTIKEQYAERVEEEEEHRPYR